MSKEKHILSNDQLKQVLSDMRTSYGEVFLDKDGLLKDYKEKIKQSSYQRRKFYFYLIPAFSLSLITLAIGLYLLSTFNEFKNKSSIYMVQSTENVYIRRKEENTLSLVEKDKKNSRKSIYNDYKEWNL